MVVVTLTSACPLEPDLRMSTMMSGRLFTVSSTRTRTRARETLGGDPWSLASTTSSKICPVWFSTLQGQFSQLLDV